MAIPSNLRDEVLEEEDADDSSSSSVWEEVVGGEEEDDDDAEDLSDASVDEEEREEEEDVGIAEAVFGTRMATIHNDSEDVRMEAQSRKPVSNSRTSPPSSSSSSPQSVKLKSSDVLDCPTCCEPLKRPIYQCTNGHLACSSCCKKLKKKCSFCRLPIGDIRCRAMEKVIEASVVPCQNAIYGCKESTSYGNEAAGHEKLCVFARCYCPIPNCTYAGSYYDIKSHARAEHSRDEDALIPFVFNTPLIFGLNLGHRKMAVLQEEKEGDLVVVQAFEGSHGVYVTVSCVAPMAPEIRNLSCSIAKLKAYTTLRLGLMVKKIQKVREQEEPKDGFMLIPSYMLSDGNLKMQICIGSEYEYIFI